jgi:hypothetical protein
MKKILISCGDSWPGGDYCWIDGYNVDYSAEINRSYSYINLLGKYFKFDEIIYLASGGNSNDEQIYIFKKHLNDNLEWYSNNNTHVLWGTTSLQRFFYNWKTYLLIEEDKEFFKFHSNYLSSDFILEKLNLELTTLRNFCELSGITFSVYNTFNTLNITNALFQGRDLLSSMTFEDEKHRENNRRYNDNKFDLAVDKKLLDPKTKHPTIQGSKFIATLLIQELMNVYS